MKRKLLLITGIAAAFTASTAYADLGDINVKKNYSTDMVFISGSASAGEQMAVQILPDSVTLQQFAESSNKKDLIQYVNYTVADDNGDYTLNAKITDSGDYKIYICGEKSDNIKETQLSFYDSGDYEDAINYLNASTDENVFAQRMEEKMEILGFDILLDDNLNISDVAKQLYSELGESKTLDATKFDENFALYKNSTVIVSLNAGKTDNICEYLTDIVQSDSVLTSYWTNYIDSEEHEKYITQKMTNANIENVSGLVSKLKEAMVLTVTRYPDGYMSIKNIFDTYKTILGLTTVSNVDNVYTTIAAKDYTRETLITAYNTAVANANRVSQGSGSGNFRGGVPSINIQGTVAAPGNAELNLKFDDLSTVYWAYSSISKLYEAGIVSGYSEYEYRPEANVKREEFTKMLLSAIGIAPDTSSNAFSDVDINAWYCGFVNAAYNNGLISGIGGNKFGVSYDIIRQDMAVIIYNALLKKGFVGGGASLSFDDSQEISEYAQNAVAELTEIGIINGRGNNLFAPKATATRAEAAVIIERTWEYLQQK